MKHIITLAVALACAFAMVSCDSFLDAENRSNVTDKDQFSTKEGFESLVANAYQKLNLVYNNPNAGYTTCFQAGTDMYGNGRMIINEGLHQYTTLDPENAVMKELYAACYVGIRAACAVKHYAPDAKIGDELRQKSVDEARVVAAQLYYLLVNTFGGVPIMDEFVSEAKTGYPRASAEAVYTYIITELEEVIANNAIEPSTSRKGGGRASLEGAQALLAQTYLAAGWDLNKTEYFAKAAQAADAAIAGRGLVTPFADLWKTDPSGNYSSDDNEEFIWDIEYDQASSSKPTGGGHEWSTFYSGYFGVTTDGAKGSKSAFIATIYALKCFERGDLRYDVTFMKEMPAFAGTPNTYWDFYKNGESNIGTPIARYFPAWYETEADIAAWRAIDPENRRDTWIIPMAEKTTNPQDYDGKEISYEDMLIYNFAGSPCRKFDDSYTGITINVAKSDYRDIHIITLPEVYLVAAEAYLKDNDTPKALERLNVVRTRAGLTPATHIDVDVILKERACELFGQGSRWIDLRRTQKLVEHNNLYNPQIKGVAEAAIGQKLLRPIPQKAIDSNDALSAEDQNPGY